MTSNSEALPLAINVPETQVDVCADALHRLDGQGTSQVFGIRPRRRQTKAKPMHGSRLGAAVGHVVEKVGHAGILCALFSCAEVVTHHLI